MSDVTPTSFAGRRTAPVAAGGNTIGQVINPPPRLPQLALSGAIISAVVLGEEAPGRLLLRSDQGLLTLQTTAKPAPGAVVSLQLRPVGQEIHVVVLQDGGRAAERVGALQRTPLSAPALPPLPLPGAPAAATATPPAVSFLSAADSSLAAGRWPALEAVLRTLRAAGQGVGRDPSRPPPRPGAALAAAWLQILSGYGAERPGGWLGNLLRQLRGTEQGADLARDHARLAALAAEPDAEGWRYLALPLLFGERGNLLWLHLRGRHSDGPEPEAGLRFLLDVDFGRLGPLQLDGLLRGPRFDLVLRSRQPLPSPLEAELKAIHREAAGLAELLGSLRFQADGEWHPMPPPAALTTIERPMVV